MLHITLMLISRFILFFANDLLQFIFILDYRNDVRIKANLIFFIQIQNGSCHKAPDNL